MEGEPGVAADAADLSSGCRDILEGLSAEECHGLRMIGLYCTLQMPVV